MSFPSTTAGSSGVTLPHLLRSEWIKAVTVNGTRWTSASVVATAAFFASTVALVVAVAPTAGEDPKVLLARSFGDRPTISVLAFTFTAVPALIALLGVLLVSSDRGTGALAVTLAAVPGRTPVLVAKLLLSGAAGFVLGLLAALATIAVVLPATALIGMPDAFWNATTAQVVLGGALGSALIAVLATAIGSLFRSTAGAAGTVLSLLLVAPVVLSIVPVVGGPVSRILPTSGMAALSSPADTAGAGTVLAGMLILAAWVTVSTALATVLWRRRDL